MTDSTPTRPNTEDPPVPEVEERVSELERRDRQLRLVVELAGHLVTRYSDAEEGVDERPSVDAGHDRAFRRRAVGGPDCWDKVTVERNDVVSVTVRTTPFGDYDLEDLLRACKDAVTAVGGYADDMVGAAWLKLHQDWT